LTSYKKKNEDANIAVDCGKRPQDVVAKVFADIIATLRSFAPEAVSAF